mmetsp:Transcript_342/g.743  ORF Transcript_342/g.743 Transcript_342/m.743 type:complete len:214 (+) Transcript_342:848-1489(+)
MVRAWDSLGEVGNDGRIEADVGVCVEDGGEGHSLGHGGVVTDEKDAFEIEAVHLGAEVCLGHNFDRTGRPDSLIPFKCRRRPVRVLGSGQEVRVGTSQVSINGVAILQRRRHVRAGGRPLPHTGAEVTTISLDKHGGMTGDGKSIEVVLGSAGEPRPDGGTRHLVRVGIRIPRDGGEKTPHSRGTDEVIRRDHPHVPTARARNHILGNIRTGI